MSVTGDGPRILITGAEGQLGAELCGMLDERAVGLSRDRLDITDPRAEETIAAAGVGVVINCAAYNAVDKAESEPAAAFRVNAEGPRNLAKVCDELGLVLVHVSTDFVFGSAGMRGEPYREDAAPGPLSAYAVSKLAGEYFVRQACRRHFVVRTCGLYGSAAPDKGSFVKTMLRLAESRPVLTVVDDQYCTPTSTVDLAAALIELCGTDAYGLYHAVNGGTTTWCRFARKIFAEAGLPTEVRAITSAEFGAPAARPPYSVLDTSKLAGVIGRQMPSWEDALGRHMKVIRESS
ncbi:MAG: dTDP-4-dehydrorhamnose reductase [Planctomycetota bacterium]